MNSAALAACLMADGAGVGLFMTPNTSSIMELVPAQRRGIANGVRQTAQNAGYTARTALTLATVTSGLPGPTTQAAYAGSGTALSPRTLNLFTHGYKWALLTLGSTCVLALIASLSRGRGTSAPQAAPLGRPKPPARFHVFGGLARTPSRRCDASPSRSPVQG